MSTTTTRLPPTMARRHASFSTYSTTSRNSSSFPTQGPPLLKTQSQHSSPNSNRLRICIVALILAFFLFERPTLLSTTPASTKSRKPPPLPPQSHVAARTVVSVPVAPVQDAEHFHTAPNHFSTAGNTPCNIAYFIQISESTVGHLPRLLASLYHEDNVYAIHLDLKIPEDIVKSTEHHIRSNPKYRSNVHIMPAELITYRGVSMLLNTINAMRLLFDKDNTWQYFINLSGADYPLLNPETQRRLLGQKTGLNYFTFAPKRTWDNMAENRLSEVWYDESLTFRRNASIGKLSKLQVRNPLVDGRQFDVSHAEAWMVSSREFCDFVIRGDMARKMLVAFSYAVDSSEHYFASLAWNHEHYKKSLVPHSLRLIVWMHKGVLSGQHPYFVDDEEPDGSYKFQENINNSVLFFARKFKKANSKLMDYIDERSKDPEVIAKAEDHITNKISSRALRISEL